MRLSVVTTLYGSAPTIDEFHRRAAEAAGRLTGDFEIILVNDGSPDDCLGRGRSIVERDDRVVLVDLSRNFGHHAAMLAGLAQARGDLVFLIDCDLEEEPEWLPVFADILGRDSVDVVYGVQERRKGGWFERWSGTVFYRLFRALTGVPVPDNPVTARLMTRRYVDALLRHEERNVFLAGLFHVTGFGQRSCPVEKRSSGRTTYTLRRRVDLFVESITSFSSAPLTLIFYVGMAISAAAGAWTLFLVAARLLFLRPLVGWTSVMASIWLLGGLIICFIGVIGIYLSKIFREVKRRPLAIVRDVYGRR